MKIKYNLKYNILNSLIESDFLLLKNHYLIKKNNFFKENKNGKNYIYFLDPLDSIKSIKRFLRILQVYKKQKNAFLNFFVQNKNQKSLIAKFFSLNNLNLNFNSFFKLIFIKQKIQNFQLLVSLGQSLHKNLSLYKTLTNDSLMLIQEINTYNFNSNFGFYKIYNNINDYKKLIFILILMENTFNKSKTI